MAQATEAVRAAYRPTRPGPWETLVSTVRDVYSRRRLIGYLARADLQKRGSDTLLGNVWWVLDPLLTMGVYVVLVTVIVRSTRDAYPLFIFCAILPWKWFSSSVAGAVTSITSKERVIKQIHFPKIVLPLSDVLAGVVGFGFGLMPLAVLLVFFYPSHLTPWVVLIPVVAAVQFILTLGLAVIGAALTVFFRDIGNFVGHVLRIWFYLSPALYGTDQVEALAQKHPELIGLYNLNPFAALFESYRNLIYYGRPPTWDLLGLVVVESFVILVAAVLVFRRLEPSFAKVI